ncbi:hypothetical protein VTH82DRAFT_6117 [Thermothelomyces myriococcoides]
MVAQPDFVRIKNIMIPDGLVYRLTRQAARHSTILWALIEDFEGTNILQGKSCIPIMVDVSDQILSNVLWWMENTEIPPGMGTNENDEHVELTTENMWFFREAIGTSERLYELLILTDYLGIVLLYDMACRVVGSMIRGRSAEQICRMLGVNENFTTKQKQAIRV